MKILSFAKIATSFFALPPAPLVKPSAQDPTKDTDVVPHIFTRLTVAPVEATSLLHGPTKTAT